MKKSLIRQLKSEDWVIVGAGAAILLLALLFPRWMPAMPKDLSSAGNWMSAGAMFLFLLVLTGVCQRILGRPLRRFAVSLLAIFGVALLSQAVASIPAIKRLGFEAVFFSVIFGLVISNFFRVPEWLKPAIQSEFYIKIGIVCLGATILFGEVLQSGVYALIQLSSSSLRCGTSPSGWPGGCVWTRKPRRCSPARSAFAAFRPLSPPAA